MGEKSRGNFKPNLCMKFDCSNRDKLCKECIGQNEYRKSKEESRK